MGSSRSVCSGTLGQMFPQLQQWVPDLPTRGDHRDGDRDRDRDRSRGRDCDREGDRDRGSERHRDDRDSRGGDRDRPRDDRRDDRGGDRGGDRERRGDRDRDDGGDDGDASFRCTVEGPGATPPSRNTENCYRAVVEMKKPGDRAGNLGGTGTVRMTCAWQGDRRTAERDADKLKRAWRHGGFDAVSRVKGELRAAARR
uniref:Uncharacterized protein n=1 Tax=Alexandrium monilatum TaxID=311494 RepID=A0A7S4T6M2_9DINO